MRSVAPANKDHLDQTDNLGWTERTDNLEKDQESQDHRDQMLSCTIEYCQFHHSAHVKLLQDNQDLQDSQDRMESQEIQDLMETMEPQDHKDQPDHLVSLGNLDNLVSVDLRESQDVLYQPPMLQSDLQVHQEEQDHQDFPENQANQETTGQMENQESQETQVCKQHQK